MKTCSRCKVNKEDSEFNKISRYYKDGSRSNTLRSWCKVCCKNYSLDYMRTDKGMAAQDKYRASLGKVTGVKRKARRALQHALETKQIVKDTVCFDCKEKWDLEAHHDDYGKPLEVAWVCRSCHGKRTIEANRRRALASHRIARGWNAKQALTQEARKLIRSGITPKQFELATLCAISPALLIHRMVKLGLTFNEAISLPVKKYIPFVDRVKMKYEADLKAQNDGVLPEWYDGTIPSNPSNTSGTSDTEVTS